MQDGSITDCLDEMLRKANLISHVTDAEYLSMLADMAQNAQVEQAGPLPGRYCCGTSIGAIAQDKASGFCHIQEPLH